MKSRRRTYLFAVAALVSATGACKGGGSTGTDAGETPDGLPVCPETPQGDPSNPAVGCDGDAGASQCFYCYEGAGMTCGCAELFRDAASEASLGWGCSSTGNGCAQTGATR